ncbi:nose resistant to fluoxetine protein 6-like isoform X2 [Chrysoperla carnea]|uniref:nose resistant to fluoxetine protein 6-like isoform X2 n=1 Tax=Chrysoperla carnea TaxID=189513 RepID=UPI001D083D80|nr:nose resistant to fluoxetine protein 6-like isoform X2 [Chrysoperla carnea]
MIKRLIEFYTLQSESNRSELCANQTKLLYHAVYNSELWAERIIDASAKFPNGITKFHLWDFGYFDECIQVNEPTVSIKGKYCLTTVTIPENDFEKQTILKNKEISTFAEKIMANNNNSFTNIMNVMWAICVPDGCTAKEVEDHLNTFAGIDIFKLDETECQTIDTYRSKLNTGDWLVIAIFTILCIIMLVSTIYDVYLYYAKKEKYHPIFIAFSWFTNFQKLTEISHNPDILPCLNGIRFLSMLWIIYGHQTEQMFSPFTANLLDFYQWRAKFFSMLLIGFSVSVDSFFLLSGCLVMYGFLKMQAKKIPFNIPVFYLHRYIRLTPSYAATIVFMLTFYRFMGSGPLWDPENSNENCKTYWWAALLYIQNYVAAKPCVQVSWYLQVDMQFYIFAPMLLVPIAKWPKITNYLLSSLVIIFVIIPTMVAWKYSFLALEKVQFNGDFDPVYDHIYYRQPYTRAAPWLLGLLLGHILFNNKNKKIIINKMLVTFLWIISIGIMLYTIFGFYHEAQPDYEYDRVFNSLFIGLHRVAWAAGLSWIIFACIHGYGGPVNWFLSLPLFQVLSRLTYSIFLTHFWLQIAHKNSTQMPYIFSNMHLWYLVCGNLLTTLIISVFWTLTFEAPFVVLDNLLIKSIGDFCSNKHKQE